MAKASRKELAQVLADIIDRTTDQQMLAKAVARFVSEHRLAKELDSIMREVERIRAAEGVVEATVTTAFPLTDALKRDIRSLISKERNVKHVVINEVVNQDVIGGLRIEAGEQQLDVTIQGKLNRLKGASI